jgi:hypothetical protein
MSTDPLGRRVPAGVLAMAIVTGPYRRRERWAWFALLTMPTLFLVHGLWLGSFPFDLGPLAFVALGLLLPVRLFFATPAAATTTPERVAV